jgi:malonyl-CoA decarboxylase
VVSLLQAEFPHLKRFATLSPVPGFTKWLRGKSAEELLLPAERKTLPKRGDGDQHPLSLLRNPDWLKNDTLAGKLEGPLIRLLARYLVREKRPDGATALDPVAHFHLSNGARIEQLNWLGDTSAKGLRESAGLMVNYLYDLREIEENHEAYTGKGKVSASSSVRALARKKS